MKGHLRYFSEEFIRSVAECTRGRRARKGKRPINPSNGGSGLSSAESGQFQDLRLYAGGQEVVEEFS